MRPSRKGDELEQPAVTGRGSNGPTPPPPYPRRLVTATVRANCRGITAAQIRGALAVTLQIGDPNLGQTTAVLAARSR